MDKIYTEQLGNQAEGHALYFKVPESLMRPGSCGYFSEAGEWRPIIHIADLTPAELKARGWQAPAQALKIERKGGIYWPMKLSESVKGVDLIAEGNANIPPAPVGGRLTLQFRTSRGAGAILVPSGEIQSKQLNRDLLALKWVMDQQNMAKFLADWEEISQQKRSLWMITNTYTAKRCANAVLSSHESTIKMGIEAEVMNLLTAKPTAEWWSQQYDGSWNKYHGDDNSGVVMFMSGIQFKVGRLWKRHELVAEQKRQNQHFFRSGETRALYYPVGDQTDESNSLLAELEPEYGGSVSDELKGTLDNMISKNESDGEDD